MWTPTILWLIAGSILCLTEFLVPTAFVAFMMGIAALLVALISLFLPQFTLQVTLWLAFSTGLVFLSRRLFTPKRKTYFSLGDDQEGETLTVIEPGKTGRVLYEGNSWRARCEDELEAIAAQERVYVLRKEGNTLIVVSRKVLNF